MWQLSRNSSDIFIAGVRMCNNSSENTAIYFPISQKDQTQKMIWDSLEKVTIAARPELKTRARRNQPHQFEKTNAHQTQQEDALNLKQMTRDEYFYRKLHSPGSSQFTDCGDALICFIYVALLCLLCVSQHTCMSKVRLWKNQKKIKIIVVFKWKWISYSTDVWD